MSIKVLLINPDMPEFITNKEYYIPSAIIYLASMLKNNNIDVKILDLNVIKYKKNEITNSIILKIMEEYKPDLVGIGCLFSGLFSIVLSYASLIKEKYKNTKIVIGGMHPTLFNKEIKENCDDIDYIISGEGEIALLKLVNYLSGNLSIDDIPALTYKKNGNVVVNTNREVIEDLNNLSKLRYDLINIQDYYHEGTKFWHNPRNLKINASLPVLTTRGCPFDCNFCCMSNMMGRGCRFRPYMHVVTEMEMLYKQYGVTHFSFMDDNVTANKKNTIALCNEIVKRGMYIQFETPNGLHINTLDKDVLDALYEAGMIRASFAIESGNEYIRNVIMGKHVKTEKIYEIIELAKSYKNLFTIAFFLIGMPEDTLETLKDTYNMITTLGVNKFYINNIIPFPGTKLFEQCVQDKLFTDSIDLTNIWKTTFDWQGFKHTKSVNQFYIKPYNITLEQLKNFRDSVREYNK